jgi:hypothetical protein
MLVYAGELRKEGTVNDHMLGEMVRIRMDELRAEASRAHLAREARRSHGWRHHLGILGVSGAPRGEAGASLAGQSKEACCA